MYWLETLYSVVMANKIMLLVLVALIVVKVLGPRLRRFWRGGL